MTTLYLEGKLITLFGKYDVTDPQGNVVFHVQGKPALGSKLMIYNPDGETLGELRQEFLHVGMTFGMYHGNEEVGRIKKEFSVIHDKFGVDFRNWEVKGDFIAWDYAITDSNGQQVASVRVEPFHLTDHFVMDIANEEDALDVLMVVLAISVMKHETNDSPARHNDQNN